MKKDIRQPMVGYPHTVNDSPLQGTGKEPYVPQAHSPFPAVSLFDNT